MLQLSFLLWLINYSAKNGRIPLPALLHAGSHSVSAQEPGPAAELFQELLPQEWGQARRVLGFVLGTVSAHPNNHTMVVSALRRRKHTQPSSKALPQDTPSQKHPCCLISHVRTETFG